MIKPGAYLLFATVLGADAQIVLDTDSGYFGDDGVAITMLMRSALAPQLRSVTVVAGNVWTRSGTAYMERNLRLLGASGVALHTGAARALVHTAAMVKREGPIEFAGALSLPAESAPRNTAIDALARTIESAPSPITILAIGPMTNLALLLQKRPDLETRIGALVFMGGNVRTGGNASKAAEFNFWFDPEAARIVLRSAIPRKVMFGLDVCNRVKLTRSTFDQVTAVKTPITDLYRKDFGERYPGFLKNPAAEGSLWDELAAGYLIDPSTVTRKETLYLDVETSFGARYGAAGLLDRAKAPKATPVEVVLDMDFARVFEIYVKALTAR